MSVQYRAVQWNRHKRVYDGLLAAGVVIYLAAFVAVGKRVWLGPQVISDPVLLIRATGTCAFAMLHIILCIGPLARLSPRFSPLLYNRRHFGVTMFGVALVHGAANVGFYHGFGVMDPFSSLLRNNMNFMSLTGFPFELLGAAGLAILFLMAATSHDFWLKNLSPRVWKSLHMGVYVAYGLIVMHVVLGPLQSERNPVYAAALLAGVLSVSVLHLVAGLRESRRDAGPLASAAGRSTASPRYSGGASEGSSLPAGAAANGWLDIGAPAEIPMHRAKVVCFRDAERVAVFRHERGYSAVSNVCAHQNGPLGEGRIVGGCITCPWHGYQYLAESGTSPPPFTEKIPTYRLKVEAGRLLLDPTPLPPGTPVAPALEGAS